MKRFSIHIFIPCLALILAGCAGNQKSPLPQEVFDVHPVTECSDLGDPGGWNIQARLYQQASDSFLVVYFDPGFETLREPIVSLRSGLAIYEGYEGNLYYYRLGKVAKSKYIGKLSFRTKVRGRKGRENSSLQSAELSKRQGTQTGDRIEVFKLERKEGTDCVLITHTDSTYAEIHNDDDQTTQTFSGGASDSIHSRQWN